ncbi:MAG: hypothetical protein ACRDRX_03575 [Pseudonocardiaceae bacterium]
MTTTNDRQARTASDLLRFLPLALIITMFGVSVLIGLVASSRVSSGVHQVIAGEGSGEFIIAAESLACTRIGDAAACTAPVAGQQLTIDIRFLADDSMSGGTCTARHGHRPVSCATRPIYGQDALSVGISDQLGVTEPELTRLRDAVPWWRMGGAPSIAEVALLCGLTAAAAAVTTYLVNKRARPQEATWRTRVAAGTGLLGLVLLVAGVLVATSWHVYDLLAILAFTPAATASAAMGAWQYQLGGAGGHDRTRRGMYAIGAAIVAALYTASYIFALFIGFD